MLLREKKMPEEHRTEEFTYALDDWLTAKQQAVNIMLQKFQQLRGEPTEVQSTEEALRILFVREFGWYLSDHLEDLQAEIIEVERGAAARGVVLPKI
jgi:hypothetical protein